MTHPIALFATEIVESAIAYRLISCLEALGDDEDYYLLAHNDQFALCDKKQRFAPLSIDFHAPFYRQRGGKEYLPKAFKQLSAPHIADATAGLGRDAWLLAYRGFHLDVYERNPYLAFLLEQAIKQAQKSPELCSVAQRLTLYAQDFSTCTQQYHAVYLDPMFPERKKNAKVKKEMQILQQLHQHTDPKEAELLACAQTHALQRVVVKRPKGAPHLANSAPHHALVAPNTRYDIYLT